MSWWAILDKALDVIDKVSAKMEKHHAAQDKKGEWTNFLPSFGSNLEKISLGITAVLLELVWLLKFFRTSKPEVSLEGDEFSQFSGRTIMDSVIGHTAEVTSGYGTPRTYRSGVHKGVDIRAKKGDPVYAPFDGVVISVNKTTSGNGGRSVTIVSSDKSTKVFLCHFSSVNVTVGQKVVKDQVIAKVGGSGQGFENRWAPHLHLEVMVLKDGKYTTLDPEKLKPVEPSEISSQALNIEGLPASLKGVRKAAEGAGKLMKNPGNSTDKKNPWHNGKTYWNGYINVVGYNSWVDGYAGCAYHLLRLMDGTIGNNRNPTFRWIVGMWVNGKNNATFTQVQHRATTAGITNVNKRLKITKNNVYIILLSISIWDSGYNNASEAHRGVDRAWNYWKLKGGVPDSEVHSNILNSRTKLHNSSVTVIDNSSNRRQ